MWYSWWGCRGNWNWSLLGVKKKHSHTGTRGPWIVPAHFVVLGRYIANETQTCKHRIWRRQQERLFQSWRSRNPLEVVFNMAYGVPFGCSAQHTFLLCSKWPNMIGEKQERLPRRFPFQTQRRFEKDDVPLAVEVEDYEYQSINCNETQISDNYWKLLVWGLRRPSLVAAESNWNIVESDSLFSVKNNRHRLPSLCTGRARSAQQPTLRRSRTPRRGWPRSSECSTSFSTPSSFQIEIHRSTDFAGDFVNFCTNHVWLTCRATTQLAWPASAK